MKLENKESNYFFVPKDFALEDEYKRGFVINELFTINSIGIVTGKDKMLVKSTKNKLIPCDDDTISYFCYRPFDTKYTIFDNSVLQRARFKTMKHLFKKKTI